MCSAAAGACATPADLERTAPDWIDAAVPGTVAGALRDAGRWSLAEARDFDAEDWWYRLTLDVDADLPGQHPVLHCEGLATLAEIWLNGGALGASHNMFLPLTLALPGLVAGRNELYLCFRALGAALAARRPRPRWKTRLVEEQNLRYLRTSLLGRMPGWSPPVAAVGPWRPVAIEAGARPVNLRLASAVDGDRGFVDVAFDLPGFAESAVTASLRVGAEYAALSIEAGSDGCRCAGRLEMANAERWWPHGQGPQRLYPAAIELEVDGRRSTLELAPLGLRTVEAEREDGGFALSINGRRLFCRGACWSAQDIVTLDDEAESLRRTLELVRDGGANLIRIGGTMTYASDRLLRLCDELGILLWQDFQFACMDYPLDDPAFALSVSAEIDEQLRRQSPHPCVVVHCGGSELEQQPIMRGIDRATAAALELLRLARERHAASAASTVFVDSSPTGGELPIDSDRGVAHYFGVGAYLAPPSELRRHDVRFATECLAFANLPGRALRERLFDGARTVTHDPLWKTRTPRDSGAGWDFEDVRDHYLALRFGVDPVALRWRDSERYLDLAEVVTGEIMARAMQEWRSAHSRCGGALIWFLQDLWPGAGWGILDAEGAPKAAWYLLRQVWQPLGLMITDEGPNGLHFHLVNETDAALEGTLRLVALRHGDVRVAEASTALRVAPRGRRTLSSAALIGGFFDFGGYYRFGPPAQDVVQVEFVDGQGRRLCDNQYFVDGREVYTHPGTEVDARLLAADDEAAEIELSTSHFLYRVAIEAPGYLAEDNYFNLMPGEIRRLRLRRWHGDGGRFRGYLRALNLEREIRIARAGRGSAG